MSYYGLPIYPTAPVASTSTIVAISANTTLGAGAATYGKDFVVSDPGSYNITLPALDVTLAGAKFTIFSACTTATNTVVPSGTDTIRHLGATVSTLTLYPGVKYVIENLSGYWGVASESPSNAVTPPQFNNSPRIATTAFVQTSLGNVSSAVKLGLGATTSITVAQAGALIQIQGGTVNLPSTAGLAQGLAYYFWSSGASTINANGADRIYGNGGKASITLGNGDFVTLVYQQSGVWAIVSGSATLGISSAFSNSLLTNGYQKLPGGLIVQWGSINAVPAGSALSVTFPLTFPTTILQGFATIMNTGGVSGSLAAGVGNLASSTMSVFNNGSSGSTAISWTAIGY